MICDFHHLWKQNTCTHTWPKYSNNAGLRWQSIRALLFDINPYLVGTASPMTRKMLPRIWEKDLSVCVFWKAKCKCVCVCVAFRPLLASSCPNGRAACSEVNHHCEPPTPSLLSPLLLHLSQEWTDTSPLARGKTSASHGPPSMSPISLRYHGPRAAAMW